MYDGWILDVYPNYEFDTMNVWLWTRNGPQQITDNFDPCFYVHGPESELRDCARRLNEQAGIRHVGFCTRKLQLGSDEPSTVLEVATAGYRQFRELPNMINRWGGYSKFQLYDVDLRLAQKYMHARGIFPMAHVQVGRRFRLRDDVFSMAYEIPPLRELALAITVCTGWVHGGSVNELPHASFDEPLSEVHIRTTEHGSWTIDGRADESELLLELVKTVEGYGPDIIYTINGDEVIFPYLYHRANVNGLGERFCLDRDHLATGHDTGRSGETPIDGAGPDAMGANPVPHRPETAGKSYFTYGRIAYKPPFYSLKGRLHIDQRSSFIHRESGLDGLVELARLACIPLQTMSRLSPGSAISAMQIGQAMREGVLIKWKKNQPEQFKTARELLKADRGGYIFDPCAGVHEDVLELDFVSLYPTIIARKNISPETVQCECCSKRTDALRVPGIGYHICKNRRGLIPKVVAPLIARRRVYKSRGGVANEARQKILKWVLVTCFGYTGYRNARFGRIECHESITAFAREILLDAMEIAEDAGYEVLHGFVDSLWLKPHNGSGCGRDRIDGPDVLCRNISRRIGMPIELEGRYKWIVFLSNKSVDVGALTRYYGLFSDGTFKVRGVELRQHSTPPLFNRVQVEILQALKSAETVRELDERLPRAMELFSDFAGEILDGRIDAHELVFNMRVSRALSEYRVFSNQLAALTQLDDAGLEVHPGETVGYVILDGESKDPYRRVALADKLDGNETYDRRKYLVHLCRVCASILHPFGYTEEALMDYLTKTRQSKLEAFG